MSKDIIDVRAENLSELLYEVYDVPSGICEYIKNMAQRLEAIENADPIESLGCLESMMLYSADYHDGIYNFEKEYNTIKQYILKTQEQEKENELLKEIIKSLFDRGCPLHQYIDENGVLMIEVDDECSTVHLGEFKGVDLDKKNKRGARMSKELEEIKSIVLTTFGALGFYNPANNEEILKDRDKVMKTLERLEAIDNAESSGALKCLERIDKKNYLTEREHKEFYSVVEQGLIKAEQYKELEKELGFDLKLLKLIRETNELDEHYHTRDIYFEYNGQLLEGSFLRLGFEYSKYIFYVHTSLPDSAYDSETIELPLNQYKKTWWLKEDRSE